MLWKEVDRLRYDMTDRSYLSDRADVEVGLIFAGSGSQKERAS